VRIVDSSNFKVATTAMAMVTVHPGGMRELHWHPNADEWQYYIAGKGRMTVVATGNKGRTMDFQEGDVGYVQKTLLHNIENVGDTDLIFLEMFAKVDRYQEFSFSEWLAHTPPELVMAHLHNKPDSPIRSAAWTFRTNFEAQRKTDRQCSNLGQLAH
jgi:oxalate decarboxylase